MLLHDDEDYDASLLLLRSSSRGNNIIRGNISVWSRSFCTIACYMIEEFGESEMSGHARDNHLSPHSRAIVFENWGVAAHESERQIATCSRDYEERGMVIIIIIVIFCVLQCRVVIPALNASSSRQQHCAVLSWWKTALLPLLLLTLFCICTRIAIIIGVFECYSIPLSSTFGNPESFLWESNYTTSKGIFLCGGRSSSVAIAALLCSYIS